MSGDSDNESGNSAATMATRQSQETLENFDEEAYCTKMLHLGKHNSLTSEKLLNWALAKVAQRRAELEAKAEREAKLAEEKAERVVRLAEEKAEREAQSAEERAQRAAKLAEERAQRAAKLAEEKAEREAQRAEERLERERERKHALELARLGAQSDASGSTSQSGCRPRERAPPMQKYEDDGK